MGDVHIRFPITCPICGNETLTALRIAAVEDALKNARPLRLISNCHDRAWNASPRELTQIREYLQAVADSKARLSPWTDL